MVPTAHAFTAARRARLTLTGALYTALPAYRPTPGSSRVIYIVPTLVLLVRHLRLPGCLLYLLPAGTTRCPALLCYCCLYAALLPIWCLPLVVHIYLRLPDFFFFFYRGQVCAALRVAARAARSASTTFHVEHGFVAFAVSPLLNVHSADGVHGQAGLGYMWFAYCRCPTLFMRSCRITWFCFSDGWTWVLVLDSWHG